MDSKRRRTIVDRYEWHDLQINEIKISNKFYDSYFDSDSYTEFPINALRIIFYLIASVSRDQYFQHDEVKMRNFKSKYLSGNNHYAEVQIRNSVISENINYIKNALEFLNDHRKEWYTTKNDNGNDIKSYGGLITMPTYIDSFGYSSFILSAYWLDKILDIEPYNSIDFEKLNELGIRSSKLILFTLWLNKLPKDTPCPLKLDTLNKKFALNYKTAREFSNKFLKSVQKRISTFNKYTFSFSHKYNKITFLKKSNELDISVLHKPKAVSKRIYYLKDHYKLNGSAFSNFIDQYKLSNDFRNVFEDAFDNFKTNCRKNGIKVSNYYGKALLVEIQKEIEKSYLETRAGKIYPNGFLRIF